jgi:hypothetical protein
MKPMETARNGVRIVKIFLNGIPPKILDANRPNNNNIAGTKGI